MRALLHGAKVVVLLLGVATAAAAQGGPPIRWMRGGHTGPISQLVYSSDGTWFASTGSDNTVKIWRTSDSMLLRTLYIPRGSQAMKVSPDNTTLCAGGASTVTALPLIRCWHTADWSVAWSADTIPNTLAGDIVYKLAFSPDNERLASSVGNRLPILNKSDGTWIADFAGTTPPAAPKYAGGLAYSPDGNLLAVNAVCDCTLLALLNASDGSLAHQFWGTTSVGYDMAFTTDSQVIVTVNGIGAQGFGAYDYLQRPWDTGYAAKSIAMSSDGTRMVTGYAYYGYFNLFNAATGKLVKQWDGHGNSGYSPSVVFSPDSSRLLTGSLDIKRWKASDGSFDSLITGQVGPVSLLAANEEVTATVGAPAVTALGSINEHAISLFRTSDGSLLRYIDYGSAAYVRALVLSPDGKHLAASDDNGLRVWNVATGALEHSHAEIAPPSSFLRPIAYTPDGTGIVEGGSNMTSVSLWDPVADTLTFVTSGPANALKFLPDGRLVIAQQFQSQTQTTVNIVTLAGHIDRQITGIANVSALAVSPDGQTIAGAGADGTFTPGYIARTWRVSDGETLQTFNGHTAAVRDLGFSWDGQTLVTGSEDATVRIWRTSDATQLHLYDTETYITRLQNPSSFPGVWSVVTSKSSGRFIYGRGDATAVSADNPDATPAITAFDVPADLTGGCKATSAKVVLDRPAPPAGLTVNLSSSSPDVRVPASLAFKSGVSKKTFKITTTAVTALETATITATLGGQTLNATTDLHPIGIAAMTLTPATVIGGTTVNGTVTIECDAQDDVVVTLSSSIPSAAQPSPATVTIQPGQTSGTFTVTTSAVTATKKPTIKAETVPDAQSKSKKLVVNP